MDDLYWLQAYGNKADMDTISDKFTKEFAMINYGPWERLNDMKPFVNGFGEKPLGANFYPKDMTKEEKVIACYQHACLLYENNLNLTNQAVRERFGLDKNKSSVASRIIADTVERGLLKVSDEQNTSTKYVSYIPFYG